MLVYTSEELTEPLDVLGPVRLVAHVATSAADTDVTAKLVDVHPNGFAQRLCDGLVRLRYRGGHDRVLPGGARRPSTRSRSSCGTRRSASSRVTGSGSRSRPRAHPKFAANLGTGGDEAEETDGVSRATCFTTTRTTRRGWC